MSESTGPHTCNLPGPGQCTMCSVGLTLPGIRHKLDNPDHKGNGEICMWGRHVFMGYMGQEQATKETIDAQGFLRTGDLGRVDGRGFLYITGRIKELLITAGKLFSAPEGQRVSLSVRLSGFFFSHCDRASSHHPCPQHFSVFARFQAARTWHLCRWRTT